MLASQSPSLIQSGDYSARKRPVKLKCSVLTATLIACLGPFSFGFVLSYPSPVKGDIEESFGWSNDSFTWFSSVSALGALFGSYAGSYSVEQFGRKLTIMLCSAPFVAGWAIIAASKSTTLVFTGRVITGLAIGAISLTVPIYIAEISPAKYRGTLGSGNQLAVTFGGLMAYSFGTWLHWRWLAITGAIPPALMVLLMTMAPETPRWLIKRGRISEAMKVLQELRGGSSEDSEEECLEIQSSLGTTEKVSLNEIKNPSVYRPLILAILLMVFQQFGGINSVIAYASVIVGQAGFNDANSMSIIIGAVQFVATGISCLIVDKLGRRILLIIPGILMAISMALLGAAQYSTTFPNSVSLLALALYITGFSLGWGPIPWLAMSEIFPTRVRGIGSGTATLVNWLGVFVITKTFLQIEDDLHSYGAYWLYAVVCLLSAIYVFFFLPETKGKTLEEIEELFSGQHGLQSFPSQENSRLLE